MTTLTGIRAWTGATGASQIPFGKTGERRVRGQKRSGGGLGGRENIAKQQSSKVLFMRG